MRSQTNSLSFTFLQWWNNFYTSFRQTNIYIQVLIICAVSRIFGWALFTVVGKQQIYSPWSHYPMDYLSFVNIWDADWYRKIAESGYPANLPLEETGVVAENPWAFMPLYPLTAGGLAGITGAPYEAMAAAVSTLSSFVAACVMLRVFVFSVERVRRMRGISSVDGGSSSESLSLWAVTVFLFAPIAPVLQVAYAESFNLAFLLVTLLMLIKRKFWWAVLWAIPTVFSRPVGVPLGATAGLLWFTAIVGDYRTGMREGNNPGLGKLFLQHASQLISALLICALALAWPVIAWIVTGQMDAYTATETAWRGSDLYLVLPWLSQSLKYFGVVGPVIFVLMVLLFAFVLFSRKSREVLHPVLVMWCACYASYLILFLNPQSSLFRMLLPLFPLALLVVSFSASRAYRILLVLAGTVLQFGWVGWLWHWKQLPGGGDYPP